MMQTSYFARPGIKDNPAAVSIALYTPRWWGKGRRESILAPTKEMHQKGYKWPEYEALLDSRIPDPAALFQTLQDKILCCYETPEKECHRFWAAYWFSIRLGFHWSDIQEI